MLQFERINWNYWTFQKNYKIKIENRECFVVSGLDRLYALPNWKGKEGTLNGPCHDTSSHWYLTQLFCWLQEQSYRVLYRWSLLHCEFDVPNLDSQYDYLRNSQPCNGVFEQIECKVKLPLKRVERATCEMECKGYVITSQDYVYKIC